MDNQRILAALEAARDDLLYNCWGHLLPDDGRKAGEIRPDDDIDALFGHTSLPQVLRAIDELQGIVWCTPVKDWFSPNA